MTNEDRTTTRPAGRGIGRRALIATAAGTALGGLGAAAPAASAGHEEPRPSRDFATFAWLGTAGWRVRTPSSTLLVDPYLSRFDTGLAADAFDPTTPLRFDRDRVDGALGAPGTPEGAADVVLVTHTHWDHFADVPAIAAARGSMVFTTLTGYHLARSMGLDAARIAVVKGGEELRLGDVVVRVVASLHSRGADGGLLFPGVRTQVPEPPTTVSDLPEGDTVGFLIRSPQGRGVLLLGASDYDDQALASLEGVDVVALPVPTNDVTADYAARLLHALDRPRTVVLVHWDDFETRLANPPRASAATRARVRALTDDIARVAPRTRVVSPRYLEPMRLL